MSRQALALGQNEFGMECPYAEKAMQFLEGIGLSVEVVPGATGFVKDVLIADGGLHVDPKCRVSGLLHDAGHLATMPAKYRPWMNGNLYASLKRIYADAEAWRWQLTEQEERALLQTGDAEATAWAFAAGKHIGIPEHVIVMDDEYNGEGKIIRMLLSSKAYLGINSLQHGGFCLARPNPFKTGAVYPSLTYWLQQ